MIRRFWEDWYGWTGDFQPWWRQPSFTVGSLVDTDKYDVINGEVVPRKDYHDKLIRQKDEEIRAFEEYSERRLKQLKEERDKLLDKKQLQT